MLVRFAYSLFCDLDLLLYLSFYVDLCVLWVLCGSSKATVCCYTSICDGIILIGADWCWIMLMDADWRSLNQNITKSWDGNAVCPCLDQNELQPHLYPTTFQKMWSQKKNGGQSLFFSIASFIDFSSSNLDYWTNLVLKTEIVFSCPEQLNRCLFVSWLVGWSVRHR